MISTLLFPLFPPDFPHLLDPLIAGLDVPVAPFTFLYLCRVARWNDCFDGRGLSCGRIGQQPVSMPPIISPIGVASGHWCLDLCPQGLELASIIRISRRQLMGDDLLGVCIDAQV